MTFNPNLKAGNVLTNEQLRSIFQCATQGGMRRSLSTNTLVIISDKTKPFYEDEWKGEILHYTGMGRKGNQRIDFHQNKTLAESKINGVDVHLFEVYEKNRYIYQDMVKLVDDPYQTTQHDFQGELRNVWIFPVKLIEGDTPPIPEDVFKKGIEQKEKQVRKISTQKLLGRLKIKDTIQTRKTVSNQHIRDHIVSELAKRRAKGLCQLCEQEAPFIDKKGEPYLEVHHIVSLSCGGKDSLNNVVALCPNCHRKMHILGQSKDKVTLTKKAKKPVI